METQKANLNFAKRKQQVGSGGGFKKYIHIPMPSWKGFGKLCLIGLMAFLSVINFMLILRIWKDYNLGYVFASEEEMN
jgi:hypothetical protein